MSAGNLVCEAEGAEAPAAVEVGAPETGKGGAPAAAAAPAGEHSHESGFTAAPCGEELRSNLSCMMQRHSDAEVAPMEAHPGDTAPDLAAPQAVVPQQAGAWSADEQQRWWQHLQVAVSSPPMGPLAADVQQEDRADAGAGADAAADGKASDDAAAKSASGLTHTDRTTQSDCSMPDGTPGATGADTAASGHSMRAEGRKRKARPGRGPLTGHSPVGSPTGGQRGSRTYSLNDGGVHYGSGGGATELSQQQQLQQNSQQRQQHGQCEGFSPVSAEGGGSGGFLRRSGGSESGGGGGYARRSTGSDPGAISRRGSGHADAAHYAALEEKVQRRLRQNREAAQRSRQRKKAYMAALEAEIKSGKSQEEALAAVRPAKAPRRGGGGHRSPGSGIGGGGGGRSSFQVPSGGHPGVGRGEDVLDSLAAAAAVVSGGSTGPMGAASMDEGQPPSPLARIRTPAGATLQQALRGPLLPTPPAAMPLLGGGSGGSGAFQLPPQLPPQLAALLASAAGGAPEAALAALQMGGLPLQGMHIDPAVLGAFAAAAAAQQQAARVAISMPPQPREMSPHQLAPLQHPHQKQQYHHHHHHQQQQQQRGMRQEPSQGPSQAPNKQQQQRLLQPPPDFALAAVPLAPPQRSRSALGRPGSGTPGGPPTITSGALGGGVSISVAQRSTSLRNGCAFQFPAAAGYSSQELWHRLAAVDGLLAPLGSGQLGHTPPPHAQAPWPHANNAQRQLSQDLPTTVLPNMEGRSSRGPAAGAPLGRTSDPSSRLKAEPPPHTAEPGAVPSSAATMLAAFRMWRSNHAATAACVRRALEAGSNEELRPAVARAQAELAACFQLKAACLGSDDAHLVLAGEHLAAAERPYAWLGSQKASAAAAALIARLGDDAPPMLTRLQASLAEQERVLDEAHAELLASMRSHAATAAAAAALGMDPEHGAGGGCGPSAEDRRRVDALRELMLHPDRLWTHFLEETGNILPQRHFALAVICRAETSAQLQRLHGGGAGLLPTAATARRN